MPNSHPPLIERTGALECAGVVVGTLAAWAVSGWLALLIVVGCALLAAAHAVRRLFHQRPPRRTSLSRCCVAVVATVWGLTILAALAAVSAVAALVLVLLATAAMLVVGTPGVREEDPLSRLPWSDLDALDAAMRQATDEELAQLWSRSASAIRHSYLTTSLSRYQSVRQIILAEAERRNPDQIARWLAEEPSSDRLHLDTS